MLGVNTENLQPSQTRRNNNNQIKTIKTTSTPQEHKDLHGNPKLGKNHGAAKKASLFRKD